MATVQHIWACSCGVETPCTFDDTKIGAYFQCPKCGESAVGLVSKRGRKEFVKLDRAHVEFLRLFEPPEEPGPWWCECGEPVAGKFARCPKCGPVKTPFGNVPF